MNPQKGTGKAARGSIGCLCGFCFQEKRRACGLQGLCAKKLAQYGLCFPMNPMPPSALPITRLPFFFLSFNLGF